MKSDKLFDGLKDRMASIGVSASEPVHKGAEAPPVADIKEIWDSQDRALRDPEKLDKSEFTVRGSNEFYYTGAYLKASLTMSMTRQQAVVAGISQASGLGADNGFIEVSKQLRQRLVP